MRIQYRGNIAPLVDGTERNWFNFTPTGIVQPDGSVVELPEDDALRERLGGEALTLRYDKTATTIDVEGFFEAHPVVDLLLNAEDVKSTVREGTGYPFGLNKWYPSGDVFLQAPKSDGVPLLNYDRSWVTIWRFLHARRPRYSEADVLNMLLCVFQGSLTIFSGAPGGGKTSFCDILAQGLGLDEKNYVFIPVQQGWTSKGDLIGYFNPLAAVSADEENAGNGAFIYSNKPLYDALRSNDGSRPVFILLDEANLSPMEYYWADFMAICDQWEKDDKSVSLGGGIPPLPVMSNVRFLATANNDHTTKEFSPRLLDRAWVVTMPEQCDEDLGADRVDELLRPAADDLRQVAWPWASLVRLFIELPSDAADAAEPEAPLRDALERTLNIYNAIRRLLAAADETGGSFHISHRAETAIWRYWRTAYPLYKDLDAAALNDEAPENMALDYALLQRVLPQIQGSGSAFGDRLEALAEQFAARELPRCAARLRSMKEKGEAQGFYTFFC